LIFIKGKPFATAYFYRKNMKMFIWIILVGFLICQSCENEEYSGNTGDIRIHIETGDQWIHDFPLSLGFTKKNPPQFAIWLEDTSGNYMVTLFATSKIATEGWIGNKGNRRKETLPHWCHKRGIVYEDGLYLPTKEHPLTDGITGATPQGNKTFYLRNQQLPGQFIIKAEFNHSVDFNESYPEEAKAGDINYSGGSGGSGQPAVIYSATILPGSGVIYMSLAGHSSPDGSDAGIYSNMEGISTAKRIVKSITIDIVE
jgi:hypothetical protein